MNVKRFVLELSTVKVSSSWCQWLRESIVFFGGGGKGQNFPTKFNWEYNGYNGWQWPNIFELSSFRSARTVKNLSKHRANLF